MSADRIQRMESELSDLSARIDTIRQFYASPIHSRLPKDEQERIARQHQGMCIYHDALAERIAAAKQPKQPKPPVITADQRAQAARINERFAL